MNQAAVNPGRSQLATPPAHFAPRPHDPNLELRLTLRADPTQVRSFLEQGFVGEGWQVQWNPDGWTGTATKGDKTMYLLFGAFAQYYEVSFGFQGLPNGQMQFVLYRVGQGCMGGLWGMMKVKKQFLELAARVHQALASQGWVVS